MTLKPVLSVIGLAAANLLQAAPIPSDVSWADQVSKIGLTGALLIAVAVLYRSSSEKDRQKDAILLKLIESVTAAVTANGDAARQMTDSNQKTQETITDLKDAVNKLISVREALSDTRRP